MVLSIQGVKQCTATDFEGFEDVYAELKFVKNALICPEDTSKLMFKNNFSKHLSKKDVTAASINIARCAHSDLNPDCITNDELADKVFATQYFE